MTQTILRIIEDELAEYPEFSPGWMAVFNLLGKVQTLVKEKPNADCRD